MEWTIKHHNLTSVSANSVFRSDVNKDEQDLPVRQKKKANSTVKRENVVSKVAGLKKQTRKHRRDSKLNGSEVPADSEWMIPDSIRHKFTTYLSNVNKERQV